MKLLIAFVTAAAALFTNVSSAADKIEIAPAAIQSFKSTFAEASEVNWSVSSNLYKADFTLNGQYASVFYEADGSLDSYYAVMYLLFNCQLRCRQV